MKVIVDVAGKATELRAVHPMKARVADVVALQEQSGMTMLQIMQVGRRADVLSLVMTSFLARRNAGMEPKWDDLYNGSLEDVGRMILEPGDSGYRKPAQAAETDGPDAAAEAAGDGGDPQEAASATPEAAADSVPPTTPTTDSPSDATA